jgi:hypothetical protein
MPEMRWPNRRISHERPRDSYENTAIWQKAVDVALATGSLQWKLIRPRVYRLTGACPRCGHQTASREVHVDYISGLDAASPPGPMGGADISSRTVDFNFDCACEKSHRGRDDDADPAGCGWGGPIAITSTIETG